MIPINTKISLNLIKIKESMYMKFLRIYLRHEKNINLTILIFQMFNKEKYDIDNKFKKSYYDTNKYINIYKFNSN